jgi:hypothetical protein
MANLADIDARTGIGFSLGLHTAFAFTPQFLAGKRPT